MSTTINYKGVEIASFSNDTKTLTTQGKYLEADVIVTDTSPAPSLQNKTVTPLTSSQSITADSGYDGRGTVTVNAMPSGSVTAPTSISGSSATVSTSTNTLTLTKSVSNTPRVTTAGYVSRGTAGNSTVSLSATAKIKAAATYTPTTSNQTISNGTYLTGTQTILGDANLVAGNIKKDVSIFGVTGTYEGGGGGGGLSGDYNTLDISFTNPSGTSEFGSIDIQMLLSDTHESAGWGDYYSDRMMLARLYNPSETITIYLPVEAYGITIEPWSNSPDGEEYGDSDLTITGSLTYLGIYDGYQIRVQGDGTINVDGVEYDP